MLRTTSYLPLALRTLPVAHCNTSLWAPQEHAAVGGLGAFAVGAWLALADGYGCGYGGGAGQDEAIAIAAEVGRRICGRAEYPNVRNTRIQGSGSYPDRGSVDQHGDTPLCSR